MVTTHERDWPFDPLRSFQDVRNLSGPLGSLIAYHSIGYLGGIFAWVVPMSLVTLGIGVGASRLRMATRVIFKALVVTLLLTSFFGLMPATSDMAVLTGSVGGTVARLVSSVLGEFGGTIVLITLLLLFLFSDLRQLSGVGSKLFGKPPIDREKLLGWMGGARERMVAASAMVRVRREQYQASRREKASVKVPAPRERVAAATVPIDAPWLDIDEPAASRPAPRRAAATIAPMKNQPPRLRSTKPAAASGAPIEKAALPPMSILSRETDARSGYSKEQLRGWSDVLESKLSNYGIEGRVTAVNQGPLVTTFEFEPAPGVKVKDIVSRADDLALAMRARSIRLIAPIPGRAVVGIEIPNPDQHVVYYHDVLKEIPDRLRYSGIMMALGVDAVGKPFHMNLCSAPHLLLAGTTGSGKSVALNVFLASILFQYRPEDVRLLIIDPKMVEMTLFDGIPHLLHPVITDPREAVKVFNYAIAEMERRNHVLREAGVKNIESYNSKIAMGRTDPDDPAEKLPYIVLVVDELADLVLTKGTDFESLLSRLSNMARAVGIHMIVATQRPSVDVIDGKTKANFPTRIAFRVATKVDSRTILDCMGAEKLLGKGDMLFVDAKHPEALRLHGAWLAETELEEMVNHWKQYQYDESRLKFEEKSKQPGSSDNQDSYFDDAIQVILRHKQGSTSLLQRKLHVGYARAARLLDQLEDAGVVGPPDGSKPREVLITNEEEIRPSGNE